MENNKVNEAANDLVDLAFDEGFEIFGKVTKAHRKVDALLDGVKNPDEIDLGQGSSYQARPYDHPKKVRVATDVEECEFNGAEKEDDDREDTKMRGDKFEDSEYDEGPEKPDDPKKISNDINQVPNQDGPSIYKSIRKQMGEIRSLNTESKEAYKKYFNGMLKKFGASSPAELDNEKKKAFFNAVDKGWTAKKESD